MASPPLSLCQYIGLNVLLGVLLDVRKVIQVRGIGQAQRFLDRIADNPLIKFPFSLCTALY
jgi:hypothetical protein